MLSHNGISSRRWKYSAYINQNKLKSCVICLKKRLQRLNAAYQSNSFICRYCFDWDYNHPSMKEPKPENHPSNEHPDSPQPSKGREIINTTYLRPIELSYKLM